MSQTVLDYALAADDYRPMSRDHLTERLHKLQRACRRAIAAEPSLTPEQRLSLISALDQETELAGL